MNLYRRRRLVVASLVILLLILTSINFNQKSTQVVSNDGTVAVQGASSQLAINALGRLAIRDRMSGANYSREQFGSGWTTTNGCDTRNVILYRDLKETKLDDGCHVLKGVLDDPYTGKIIDFVRGASTSGAIQIDHVVALSDAWQTGAQQLSKSERIALANDPLELLAVDGSANQQKSGSNAANWLPPNKIFRCQYVARQIAVKLKYKLWITGSEDGAIRNVLATCPRQTVIN